MKWQCQGIRATAAVAKEGKAGTTRALRRLQNLGEDVWANDSTPTCRPAGTVASSHCMSIAREAGEERREAVDSRR